MTILTPKNGVEINNKVAARTPNQYFKKLFTRARQVLKLPANANVSLVLVGKVEMIKLNKQWRGIDRVTDVLSFSALDQKKGFFINSSTDQSKYLGEIVICYPQAKVQSKKLGHSLTDELGILFVHGLLHLSGHHHSNKKEQAAADELTQKILIKNKFI